MRRIWLCSSLPRLIALAATLGGSACSDDDGAGNSDTAVTPGPTSTLPDSSSTTDPTTTTGEPTAPTPATTSTPPMPSTAPSPQEPVTPPTPGPSATPNAGAPSIPPAGEGGNGGEPAVPSNGGGGAGPAGGAQGVAGEGPGAGAGGQGGDGPGPSTGDGSIWDFVEDPGVDCPVPEMPSVASLTADAKLPDPFTKMDGTAMTDRSEWVCRREEILQQGYEFIYGEKPRTPKDAVSGSVSNNSISVEVDDGGSTSFSVTVTLPSSGSAPYPAVIGFGGIGFSSELGQRGIASINYSAYTVGAENGGSGPKEGAFYDVYGSDHPAGLLTAWAWGVSRILDVLEQDPSVIDPTRIGVTGCSRFGKGAFVVGVLDNRIALTVPVESGVGGTPALRLIGDLDSNGEWPYHAISYQRWYSAEKLGQFATANNAGGDTTDRLPVDMHEMIGLVAPRGLYIVDNPSTNYAGLNRNSAWVTANAGRAIYEALGVGDNISYQGASGGHCQWRAAYTPSLVASLEKFLLGDDSAATGNFETDFNGPNPEDHYDWSVPTLAGEL